MINGIHHISLATTDLDRLLGFYRDLLGLSARHVSVLEENNEPFETIVGMKGAKGRAASLRAGNCQIEFFQYTYPVPKDIAKAPACDAGIRHICFDVTDIRSEYERLKAAGIEFVSEPQHLPKAKATSVYAYDPDGNIVEMQEIHEGSPIERVPLPPRASTPGAA
jgi:catechol 2,3-dioxygenase-like lactoylglutathione lyase family enzyme